jgi:peptide deformylase
MAIRKIITEPNKLLRKISLPVENVGKKEQQLMDDMLDTMYAANGIGLAAIQIGVPKNVVVIDLNKDKKKLPMFFVNPKITSKSKSLKKYEEGCLSIPNLFAEIERPSECEIQYLDYFGKEKTLTANGLLATCIQHEVDHLKGILFIDYLSKLKKDIILKKLSKQKIDQKRLVI